MANLEYRKLSDEEVQQGLEGCPGWRLAEGRIERDYDFTAYAQGLMFASHVGYLAEALDHHPDLAIGYKKVIVSISTHAVSGISPYDFELARRIDK